MSEAEARSIRFTIDHYEPKEARKDLEDVYSNLMWACDTCNNLKGTRHPPLEARPNGHRFFRPDQDLREDHFERHDIELRSKTKVGYFTIEALDLNRQQLKRIRELRIRLTTCDQYVAEGIVALRSLPIDTFPAAIRAKAKAKLMEAIYVAEEICDEIDTLLREYAKSDLIDPDPDVESRKLDRAKKLKEIEALYPGKAWRAPRRRIRSKKRN